MKEYRSLSQDRFPLHESYQWQVYCLAKRLDARLANDMKVPVVLLPGCWVEVIGTLARNAKLVRICNQPIEYVVSTDDLAMAI